MYELFLMFFEVEGCAYLIDGNDRLSDDSRLMIQQLIVEMNDLPDSLWHLYTFFFLSVRDVEIDDKRKVILLRLFCLLLNCRLGDNDLHRLKRSIDKRKSTSTVFENVYFPHYHEIFQQFCREMYLSDHNRTMKDEYIWVGNGTISGCKFSELPDVLSISEFFRLINSLTCRLVVDENEGPMGKASLTFKFQLIKDLMGSLIGYINSGIEHYDNDGIKVLLSVLSECNRSYRPVISEVNSELGKSLTVLCMKLILIRVVNEHGKADFILGKQKFTLVSKNKKLHLAIRKYADIHKEIVSGDNWQNKAIVLDRCFSEICLLANSVIKMEGLEHDEVECVLELTDKVIKDVFRERALLYENNFKEVLENEGAAIEIIFRLLEKLTRSMRDNMKGLLRCFDCYLRLLEKLYDLKHHSLHKIAFDLVDAITPYLRFIANDPNGLYKLSMLYSLVFAVRDEIGDEWIAILNILFNGVLEAGYVHALERMEIKELEHLMSELQLIHEYVTKQEYQPLRICLDELPEKVNRVMRTADGVYSQRKQEELRLEAAALS